MKTGAAYIRVSTEEQIEFSPHSQLKKIQEYAAMHQILLPEETIFVDEGISGRCAEKRPAFMRMIKMAKQKPKPFDVILLWKFSRFARNRQDSILYKTMLRKECGIDVISITEQLSHDPTAILVEALLEAMDEYYSINLAQEVRRGMNEKFSRGGVVSAPPFGYRMGREHFEADPDKAAAVQWIYRAFLDGKSCRFIAAELNKAGICTARGRQFQSRSISYILSNPVYTGMLRRRTRSIGSTVLSPMEIPMEVIKGAHIPIIPEKQFLEVQKKLRQQKILCSGRSSCASSAFMLQGLVRCHNCGGVLTRTAGGKGLQCNRYAKGKCRDSHYISLNKINSMVIHAVKKNIPGHGADPLFDDNISEADKNRLLRSLLSSIVFFKNTQKIELFFRTFTIEISGKHIV